MLRAHQPLPEVLELRLTSSSLSAANSSITASNSMEGRIVNCCSEDGDEGDGGYVQNIPHLMLAVSDDEGPEDDHKNNSVDRFEAMLQQQGQQAKYLDDSNASIVFLDPEEDKLSAGEGIPTRKESPFRSIVSKMSRNSSSGDSESSTPVMMMVDLDDDDNDSDLPSILSESNLETKIFTSKMLSVGPMVQPEPRLVTNLVTKLPPPQPPPTPCSAQLHRASTNASHQRSNSSFSSASSQSSFRSILRNGGAGKTAANDVGLEHRTPLFPRSANMRETTNGRNAMGTPNRLIARDKENPQPGQEASKSRGSRSEQKQRVRGRSVEKRARTKSRRSVSYSSSNGGNRSKKKNHDGNIGVEDGKVHRRTVSFPAELIQAEKPCCYSNNSRSPVQSALGRCDDPALGPILLDTKRARKSTRKATSHVRNGRDISPRTAEFLANDSPAVIAMCRAQEREKEHERPHFPVLANGHTSDISAVRSFEGHRPRGPAHPPAPNDAKETPSPKISYRSTFPPPTAKLAPMATNTNAVNNLNPKPAICDKRDSSIPVSSSGDNSLRSTSSESSGDVDRKVELKRRYFVFPSNGRKRKTQKSRLTNLRLLSPVDEMGEGSTTCGLTPTPLSESASADVNIEGPKAKGLATVPSSTSSKGSFTGSRDYMVSPVSTELQKAAAAVWGESNWSPSSAASRGGNSKVGVECSCVIL